MADVLHKTADPVDYRLSVNTPDFDPAEWFINPDVSAVSAVPKKYWARPLTDPVTEMTQPEKDAVDAAILAAELVAKRSEATAPASSRDGEGIRTRALIENANQRINYLTLRVIQIENALAAIMAAAGGAQVGRDAAIAQATSGFPQVQSADASAYFANIAPRPLPQAVQDFIDDINAGNQDT